MNILVTGAGGQLGKSIKEIVDNTQCQDRYIFTDVADLDITDRSSVSRFLDNNAIDLVVNCAAYTAVDAAEDDPEKASLVNTVAAGILAEEIKKRDGFLIHISTDYIFGGNRINTPIKEDDTPCPVSVYGKTKLEGEHLIASSGVNAIILRTAWLYSTYGKNFLNTMLRLTGEKDTLKVVYDQVGSPTFAGNLASAIVRIISGNMLHGYEGIYHITDEGVCSWFDFASAIAAMAHHDNCMIAPCLSAEYPAKAERPAYSVLDKSKFKRTFGITLPHWQASLAKILKVN